MAENGNNFCKSARINLLKEDLNEKQFKSFPNVK